MANRFNYPEWVTEVIQKTSGEYNPGRSDYTATSLLKPPYLKALEAVHKHELDLDPADMVASVLGTAIHAQWEKCLKGDDRYVVEERFYREIVGLDGKTYLIGGQIDLFEKESGKLWDTKNTSVYKIIMADDHHDYEAQASINRWLMQANGYNVERFSVAAFLSDWRRSEARRNPDYPQSRFHELKLPLWSLVDTENFIKERIDLHEKAKQGLAAPCSEKERWARPSTWAVMKEGRKTAVKLWDNEAEAIRMAGELGAKHSIEHRPGEDIRCDSYCTVKTWCSYYRGKSGEKED